MLPRQALQEFAVWVSRFRGTTETRGRSRLGEPGRLPECLCWSGRWLVCLACLSVVGPDTESSLSSGCWHPGEPGSRLSRSVSSLVDALAAAAARDYPIRDASYSCLASEIPANRREGCGLGSVAQSHQPYFRQELVMAEVVGEAVRGRGLVASSSRSWGTWAFSDDEAETRVGVV